MYNLNMFMRIPLSINILNLQSILFPTLITMKETIGIEKVVKCVIQSNLIMFFFFKLNMIKGSNGEMIVTFVIMNNSIVQFKSRPSYILNFDYKVL
jgi:hypothetical protein